MNKKANDGLTKSQLAHRYNISTRTMSKWLDKLPSNMGRPVCGYYFSPEQVRAIYDRLGQPNE